MNALNWLIRQLHARGSFTDSEEYRAGMAAGLRAALDATGAPWLMPRTKAGDPDCLLAELCHVLAVEDPPSPPAPTLPPHHGTP